MLGYSDQVRVEWFQPSLNRPAYKRLNVRMLRFMAGSWVVLGFFCAAVGLVSGRWPRRHIASRCTFAMPVERRSELHSRAQINSKGNIHWYQ
jgi:hypothetical protein